MNPKPPLPDAPAATARDGADSADSADSADAAADCASAAFYDYVRGRSDTVPAGHSEAGLRAYRHLVYIGACQMVESAWPELPAQLGEENWRTLMQAFVRQSQWTSHFYGDLIDEFKAFLARQSA